MRYVLVRVPRAALILLGVSAVAFLLPRVGTNPTEVALRILGPGPPPGALQSWIRAHGLDQPLWVLYWHWLLGILHGNFGIAIQESTRYHVVGVDAVIRGELARSMWLVVPATILAMLVAIPVGLIQAVRRGKPYDHAMTTLTLVIRSTPTFLVCILLAWYVGVRLHIGTPTIGTSFEAVPTSQLPSYIVHHFDQFVLPYLAVTLISVGTLTSFVRRSATRERARAYVRTARAKGATSVRVVVAHVLRPAMIPFIPVAGLAFSAVMSYAIVVESIFNYPGIGFQTLESTKDGDYSVISATVLLAALAVVVWNLAASVCMALVDPRVRRTTLR